MYQKTRILLDWTGTILLYLLVLVIIPFSSQLAGTLETKSVDFTLNFAFDLIIAAVYLGLLVYLVVRGRKSSVASYLWLVVFFVITIYFLMQIKITGHRLHYLGYGVLSLTLYRSLRHNIASQMLYVQANLFIMIFAILDESMQISGLGGRSFEIQDIGIDWLSGLTGQCLIALVVRPKLETINIKIRRYMNDLDKMQGFLHSRKHSSHS